MPRHLNDGTIRISDRESAFLEMHSVFDEDVEKNAIGARKGCLKNITEFRRQSGTYNFMAATARMLSSAAAMVSSMSWSVCSVDRNQRSNWPGWQ